MSLKLSSQKAFVSLPAMNLAIFWIVAVLTCCECSHMNEKQVLADIRQLESNRNIPALFKRTYVEWLGETECISQSLKSSEAEIKQKGPLRFSMKARISARTENPLMNVELWLEFYNLTKKVHKSNKYEAIIRPINSEIQSTNQTSLETVITQKSRLVEISFNVTEMYHTSRALGKKFVNFRINIHGHPKRIAKELHGFTEIKAFLIIQEYVEICSDRFPIRQPGRFKRSLDLVDKELALKSNVRTLNQHHLKIQSTVNSMLNILHDNAGMNFSKKGHLQKRPSRMLLKNLHAGFNTKTFNRSFNKKKRLSHRERGSGKNSTPSSLRDMAGTTSSNTNTFQKTSLSISNTDSQKSKAISTKEFNSSHQEPRPTTNSNLKTLHDVDTSTSNRNPIQEQMLKTSRSDAKIWRAGRTLIKDLNDRPTINSEPSSFHDINTNEFQKRSQHKNFLKALHPNSDADTRTSCGLKDWYVSFEHLGWDSWVIAPDGVRAKTCSGVCSFPMGSQINSTAHAHLQSFAYYFKGEKWPACCVPNDFEPLTMIVYDITDQLFFMAKYPNMIATSCACL